MYDKTARDDLEKINSMFSVGVNFEEDWLRFLGSPIRIEQGKDEA